MDILIMILFTKFTFNMNTISINQKEYKTNNTIEKTDNNINTVEYVDQIIDELEEITEKEKITSKDKKTIKNRMIEIKDFIIKNGKIKGKSFKDLSKPDKEKILKRINDIDEKIEKKYPDYKNKLKIYTKNEYNKMKAKIKEEINEYMKTAGKEKIEEQKEGIKNIASNIKTKIINWINS